MFYAPRYLRDYPKVTLLGGPLSHTNLQRGNCVPELQTGSCHRPTYWQHNKIITATDFGPGDITGKQRDNGKESIDDELARHYAKHRLDDLDENSDSDDKEVQLILSPGQAVPKVRTLRDVGSIKRGIDQVGSIKRGSIKKQNFREMPKLNRSQLGFFAIRIY